MTTLHRYPLDPTGVNPNNFISGEVHTLSARQIRVAVPKHGPFFSDSVVVYDGVSMQRLNRGVDYRIPTISQELSLRYGQEIAETLLIENQSVSSTIRVSYQALGGEFQNNIDSIVQIFEAWVNDNRSVDWSSAVFGKPNTFPPAPHPHYLADVFGFEPITFELERIVQAIGMANAEGYELLYKGLKGHTVSEEDVANGVVSDKYVSFERLLQALQCYNFNSIKLTPERTSIFNGKSFWVKVEASNAPLSEVYHWSIEHIGTSNADFITASGIVTLTNGVGEFMVQVASSGQSEKDELFRLVLKRHNQDGVVLMRSYPLTLVQHRSARRNRIIEGLLYANTRSTRVRQSARVLTANRGLWQHTFS